MPGTLQSYLVATTPKAADELIAAFLRIPEDRRGWSPEEKARTALDQVAECALLNGYTAEVIQKRKWPVHGYEAFAQAKAEVVAGGWERIETLLRENTERVIAVISTVPDDALDAHVMMPWGKQTWEQRIAYP